MKYSGYLFFFIVAISPMAIIAKNTTFTIIHTNDLHSHLIGFSPYIDHGYGEKKHKTVGGWARIATVIKEEKQNHKNPVIVVDSGDFLIGALLKFSCHDEDSKLLLMGEMGYDVITLGNHDFDLKPDGLAQILISSSNKGSIPEIILSNAVFSKESKADDLLEESFNKGLVKKYSILDKNGVKIGLYGIMGKHAAKNALLASPVKFRDTIEVSREMIIFLKNKKKVDMVICLSHGGLNKDKSKSEDEILAKEIDGIDIIISGHSHTKLLEPIIENDTIIVQAGEYGMHAGILNVAYKDGVIKLQNYRIIEIDERIKADEKIQRMIKSFIKKR